MRARNFLAVTVLVALSTSGVYAGFGDLVKTYSYDYTDWIKADGVAFRNGKLYVLMEVEDRYRITQINASNGNKSKLCDLPTALTNPYDVAYDGSNFFVVDGWNQSIKVYTNSGGFVRGWKVPPSMGSPNGVTVVGNHVWVRTWDGRRDQDQRIIKYTKTGGYLESHQTYGAYENLTSDGFYLASSDYQLDWVGFFDPGNGNLVTEDTVQKPTGLYNVYSSGLTHDGSDIWFAAVQYNSYEDFVLYVYKVDGGSVKVNETASSLGEVKAMFR